MRGVINNDTTQRDNISQNGLLVVNGELVSVSMMLKTVMVVEYYCNIFNYGPQRPQKGVKSKYITIVTGSGVKPEPTFALPGNNKGEVRKEPPPPPDLINMYNLETSLIATVDKTCGNSNGFIVERFIKLRYSTMFGHPEYSLDGPGL